MAEEKQQQQTKPEDGEKMPKVVVRTERAPGYRSVPCNGLFGAKTNGGLIFAQVYTEALETLGEFIRDQEEGTQAPAERVEVNKEQALVVRRTYEFGLFITPQMARSMAEWLETKAGEAEAAAETEAATAKKDK